jgi:hypothetical protein
LISTLTDPGDVPIPPPDIALKAVLSKIALDISDESGFLLPVYAILLMPDETCSPSFQKDTFSL